MTKDIFTEKVIGCAIEVHKGLGPGLLESAYQKCLAYELESHGFQIKTVYPIPVNYKSIYLDCGYRIDILVNDQLVVELKAVDNISNIYKAQLLTYLKLAKISTGLLINFNVSRLADGIVRLKN